MTFALHYKTIHGMRIIWVAMLLACSMGAWAQTSAQTSAQTWQGGQQAELPQIVDGLVLNGTGTRHLLFAKLYTCRLFVPRQVSSFEEISKLNGPIELHLDVHGDPPGKLPDDWARVLDEELSQKLFERVKSRYRKLDAGDRVIVVYKPGEGTSVWLNTERQFTDPGPGLMMALLEQWIGDRPVSVNLRHRLLGSTSR